MSTQLSKQRLLAIHGSGVYTTLSPAAIRELQQETAQFLSFNRSSLSKIELFDMYELQFYVSLICSEDVEAKKMLDRIIDHFGASKSQRIRVLQSVYYEALDDLEQAKKALLNNISMDENLVKRRLIQLGKNANKPEIYIEGLVKYLDLQPLDTQAWIELSDEYSKQGQYNKSIYCLKEVLLIQPFAYNILYRIGLYNYYLSLQVSNASANVTSNSTLLETYELLNQARLNFLRSIELSDTYVKSWLGLYYITLNGIDCNSRLTKIASREPAVGKYLEKNKKLNEVANKKLQELKVTIDDKSLVAEMESLLTKK